MKEFYCEQCHHNCTLTMEEEPERLPYVCPEEAIKLCRWVERKEAKNER